MKRDLPMRGTVGDLGEGVQPHEIRLRINGIEQERCVLAFDVEQGWITRLVRGVDGKIVVDWRSGRVRQETLRGKVEVEWNDSDRAAERP